MTSRRVSILARSQQAPHYKGPFLMSKGRPVVMMTSMVVAYSCQHKFGSLQPTARGALVAGTLNTRYVYERPGSVSPKYRWGSDFFITTTRLYELEDTVTRVSYC